MTKINKKEYIEVIKKLASINEYDLFDFEYLGRICKNHYSYLFKYPESVKMVSAQYLSKDGPFKNKQQTITYLISTSWDDIMSTANFQNTLGDGHPGRIIIIDGLFIYPLWDIK